MRIWISGATGFLGKNFLKIAIEDGHNLICTSSNNRDHIKHPHIEWKKIDLSTLNDSTVDLRQPDWAVHLAINNDNFEKGSINDRITQNFLSIAERNNIKGLMLAGSIAIYNFRELPSNSKIDSNSLEIVTTDGFQDSYSKFKLRQEKEFRSFVEKSQSRLIIPRIGLLFSSDRLSDEHVGFSIGPIQIVSRHCGQVPLSNVVETSRKMLELINGSERKLTVVNLIDEKKTTQEEYLSNLREKKMLRAIRITLDWQKILFLVGILNYIPAKFLGANNIPNRMKLGSLARRIKPFRY